MYLEDLRIVILAVRSNGGVRAGETRSMKSLLICASKFNSLEISFLPFSFNLSTLQFYINLCHALLCYKCIVCFIYSTNLSKILMIKIYRVSVFNPQYFIYNNLLSV